MLALAVVGASHIHLRDAAELLTARSDVRVVWVWDPDPGRAREWAARLDAEPVADLGRGLARGAAGALVYSQPSLHRSIAAQLAAARMPAFIEKPLAVAPDAAELIAAQAVQPFQIGFFLRYCPALQRARELIDTHRIGELRHLAIRVVHDGARAGWFDGPHAWMAEPREGGGGFADLVTHCVDLAGWLVGEPLAVQSARLAGRHHGSAVLRSAGGVMVECEAGWQAAEPDIACRIDAERGSVQVRGGTLSGDLGVAFQGPAPSARDAIAPWIDALLDRPASLVPIRDAVGAVALVAALRAASESGLA